MEFQEYRDNRRRNNRNSTNNDRGSDRNYRGRGGFRGRGGNNNAGRRNYGEPRPQCLSGEGAIFPITILPDSKAYRYDVEMIYKHERRSRETSNMEPCETLLTTEKRDHRTRQLCYIILSIVMEETDNFACKTIQIAYDNQSTLFTNKRLPKAIFHTIDKHDLSDDLSMMLPNNGRIEITIKQNEQMDEIDLSDYNQYEARELLLTEDQTLRQVLEIILSQGSINSGDYSVVGNGQLYRLEEDIVERGICTRIGSHKGIRMIDIESKDENGKITKKIQPAIVLDFKRSPFYSRGIFLNNVLKFIQETREESSEKGKWKLAEIAFKGIKVCPLYNRGRVLRFTGFTTKKLCEMSLTLDSGEQMTLPEFYAKKKRCGVQYVNYPAATCGRDGDFPLELLQILDDQRVDLQYLPSRIRDAVHKKNAVDPQVRYNNIMDEFDRLDFNNEITKGFGISIDINPLEKGTVLKFDRPEKPVILLGKNKRINPSDEGKFNISYDEYFIPCVINKWVVLRSTHVMKNEAFAFKNKFVKEAEKRGVIFKTDADCREIDTNVRNNAFNMWNFEFTKLKKEGYQYILFIDRRDNLTSHGMLKLMESLHKIVTQHVNYETVLNIIQKNQNVTLGNILMKFNVKNGGTNYKPLFNDKSGRLDINKGNVLVVGYDVSHPTGVDPDERSRRIKDGFESETKDPSIVGITANFSTDPSSFIGDFFFQATRKESVDRQELKLYMKRILEHLKKNREKQKGFKMPEIIVILRDGISEGQFKMSCEEELPALKDGCFAFDQNYKPKFVFIVATKRHHKRFFEGQKGKFDNPIAGSFVDENVVRPDCIEFFMASHKTIKGTTKFVQVSVINNDLNATRDEIKNFLHSLCYGHQVVCSPTSLPTPIYIADELATRGSEVYKVLKDNCSKNIPWNDNEINYLELTHMLNYSESKLANVRFNA